MSEQIDNWHQTTLQKQELGDRIADMIASILGSWRFIIIQSIVVAVWIFLNVTGFIFHWDPYPFIVLNLLFSTQAAYAAPLIMMSQNRQGERDRAQAQSDYITNIKTKEELDDVQRDLDKINQKLDHLLEVVSGELSEE